MSDYEEDNDYNDITDADFTSCYETDTAIEPALEPIETDDQRLLTETDTAIESAIEPIETDDQRVLTEDEQPDEDLIINQNMVDFFSKLYNHISKRNDEFSQAFTNELLEEFNNHKRFTDKHTKYSIDKYGLLIRENKYNNHTDAYGWVFDCNEPINIHITDELKRTKTKEEIFDIVMTELTRKNKINLTPKSIPGQIYKIVNIDVSKWMKGC